ncbi:conserved hypothetical protein [Thermoplasma acidophilum]|uniref:Uncharacterized protein n=1 Tax=Thermoplasma acidophilum (strain ATCC 25905 / DSM 1728 / JCM 9062 / NBRC 15155 / AMRC-C165) TaxID=273075 RepID=Q9HJ39_THEAC|nr:hypothetical protein [Thermoplasma acidophilum]CAC12260.1 conserved hypothetical protein [Thermoplasma acidophilum]
MPRVGIITSDFKFYHDVIKQLRLWKIPFVSLDLKGNIPDDVVVILSSIRDDIDLPDQVKAQDGLDGIRRAIPRLLNKTMFKDLTIGIDPGPKPGIAVFGDDVLLEAFECPTVFSVRKFVDSISMSYSYENITIKIGNGDRPNRDIIMNRLSDVDISIEVVNEKNTSTPHKIHDNALSAARIAQINGLYPIKRIPVKFSRKNVYEKEFVTLKNVIENAAGTEGRSSNST